MKNILNVGLTIIFFLFLIPDVHSQPGIEGSPNEAGPIVAAADDNPDPGGDPNAPLDGGLLWLLLAGAGYGARKIYDQRKKNRNV